MRILKPEPKVLYLSNNNYASLTSYHYSVSWFVTNSSDLPYRSIGYHKGLYALHVESIQKYYSPKPRITMETRFTKQSLLEL